jgi:uncharacterized membrane protein YqjE
MNETTRDVISPLDVLRLLRSAGGALLAQATLHGQLARVEWEVEKQRLLKLLCVSLLGFSCFLCLVFFIGVAVLACSWDTAYRLHAMAGLIVVYGAGASIALYRIKNLLALGSQAFAATRAELAADVALIKSTL